jgi:hypothetical protein
VWPMDFAHFRKAIVSPALLAITDYWDEARGSALMPSWEQLQPSRIAPYLSIVWAFKYDATNDQFVGRLAGNAVAWGFQQNFRGVALTDLWSPEASAQSHQKMLYMISEANACRKAGKLFRHAGRLIEGERIALPLATDGVRGDGVLGASVYEYPLRNREQGSIELLEGGEVRLSIKAAKKLEPACRS